MQTATVTKVLLVDDLPENLQALAKIIEQPDREIFQASSGDAALNLLLEHEFALAMVDVMMPGMSGFELAELMRGAEKTRHIPIIFVSAGGKELNFAFKGYESGAVDFLHKPLDVFAVKSKVNVFVALYQQRNEVRRQLTELEAKERQLRETQEELQRALKMRDDFISLVAHELRTPLNTLHVESQLRQLQLNKGMAEAFSLDKIQAMVTRDARQIQSMIRLISDMTDVSRIQSGKLSIHVAPVDLSSLLQRIVGDLSQQAQAAGSPLRLNVEPGIVCHCDEIRVEQIIINLLTNALRYGAAQPVDVELHRVGKYFEVLVRDQGLGIDPAEQERIFDKFERAAGKDVCDGLGMGLYIARQLAEAHQGSLTVESQLGEGATFTLRLPC